jgi:hypothetical protein
MEYEWAETEFDIKNAQTATGARASLVRLQMLLPHITRVARFTIGVFVVCVLVFLPGVTTLLTPTARFFAVIIPPLATGRSVGATIRLLVLGLPLIVATVFLSAVLLSTIPFSGYWLVVRGLLLALGAFTIQWGGGGVGPLGKKLANGVWVSTVLSPTAATVSAAASLAFGFALGYAGAVVAAFIPFPVFAVREIRRHLETALQAIAELSTLLTQELRFSAPWLSETVKLRFHEVDEALAMCKLLDLDAQAELPHMSTEPLRASWLDYLKRVRYHLKGMQMANTHRDHAIPDETYRHYDLFRRRIMLQEKLLGQKFAEFFRSACSEELVMDFEQQFQSMRKEVLTSRIQFLQVEYGVHRRGFEYWPSECQHDLFSMYFGLANLAIIDELSEKWAQISRHGDVKAAPPPFLVSDWTRITNGVFRSLQSFAFSFTLKGDVPRLVSASVLVVSVLIASLLALIPSWAQYFASGASAATTCVFVFSDQFGSSLTVSRDRLVGVTLGGAYAYFAIAAAGDVVAIAVLMVVWVAVAFFLMGEANVYTAQASTFAVSLALFNSGINPSFTVVSSYLVANCVGVVLLVVVGSIFWLLSIMSARPSLLSSLCAFLDMTKVCVDVVTERFVVGSLSTNRINGYAMEDAIALVEKLEAETNAEPSFGGPAISPFLLRGIIMTCTSLVHASRFVDMLTLTMVEEEEQMEEVAHNVRESIIEVHKSMHETFDDCIQMLQQIETPLNDFAAVWRTDDLAHAKKRFLDRVYASMRRTYDNTSKSVINSRAVVRYIASCFAVVHMMDKLETLYHEVFEFSANARIAGRLVLKHVTI